jgi:hypothetical protein
MNQPRIKTILFRTDPDKTVVTVDIDAAGCPGIESGERSKVFPAVTKITKIKEIVESMVKKHPKDWDVDLVEVD